MALIDKIPAIIDHINKHRDTLEFNQRLFCILEGQLRKEVEDSLRREMVSIPAFNRAIQRIPAINIHKKAIDKLSQLYTESVVREAENETDRDILKTLEKTTTANSTLSSAQNLYNSQYMCAIEPFVEDGMLKSRVLPGHTFLPFSDDINNPLKMTAFIKFLPPVFEKVVRTDRDGKEEKNEVRETSIFAIYSDDEFLVIDDGGAIRTDMMATMEAEDGKNPFGVIPFIYINRSKYQLIPFVNQEALDISVLIAKLLTDLNYAVQFQSHSMIWTKNTNLSGVEINPDQIIDLGDRESPEHGDPEMGVIKPEVDIERILQLIQFELNAYLSTLGIKTTNIGSMMPGREASGISKAIDEGDASNEQKRQAQEFKLIEKNFWKVMDKAQSYFASIGEVNENRKFSPTFLEDFSVQYSEAKAFKSDMEKINELKVLRDAKLATKRQAVQRLNPDFTPKQLDEYVKELEDEKEKEMDAMLAIAGRSDPESDPNPEQRDDNGGAPTDGDS